MGSWDLEPERRPKMESQRPANGASPDPVAVVIQSKYEIKMAEVMRRLGDGEHRIVVCHDGWCRSFQDQPCDCDPDILVGEDD